MRGFMGLTKALADENRVRTLMFLAHGELCLCQIVELLSLAPSTVSKHLAILKQARLLESRKQGRWHYYRLASKDTPKFVRATLRWLQNVLSEDKRIARDSESLKAVLRMDKGRLCKRYKS